MGHPRWPGPKGAPGPTGPGAEELLPPDPPELAPDPEPELEPEPEDDPVDGDPVDGDPVDDVLELLELAEPEDAVELDDGDDAVLTGTCAGRDGAARRWELRVPCALRCVPRARVRRADANRSGNRRCPVARSPRSGSATARWSRPSVREAVPPPPPTIAATRTVSMATSAQAAISGRHIPRRAAATACARPAAGLSAQRRQRALRGRRLWLIAV
jgi:hypothetical protein